MISDQELELANKSIEFALAEGADACRAVLNKNVSDMLDTLNSQIDKVTHCLDRSLSLMLFVDGKFASFSTNRLEGKELADFVKRCVLITRMLEKDECRTLPQVDRCCHDATLGTELGIYDPQYATLSGEERKSMALAHCLDINLERKGYKIISEEGQYCDSEFDSITLDSNGLYCRHFETSFEYASEVTIQSDAGEKYSSYWWTSSPFLKDFDYANVGEIALKRAVEQIGSQTIKSGKRTMVVGPEVSSKLLTPILQALGGYAIQQNNSFLNDSLSKKVFSYKMNLVDEPHRYAESGSRLFDSEGVATRNMDIIREGVIKTYFLNTYIANKLGEEATIEDATRAHLLPSEKGLTKEEILKRCHNGILVTNFNGGNFNGLTGDFSYGIEGYEFKDGKITRPVNEMLITGNFIQLWSGLLYAGDDPILSMTKLIPTLAFEGVDFSGK